MLAPTSASARATIPNARAVIGRPRTTTAWVECRARRRVVVGLERGVHLHRDARHRLLDGLLQALGIVVGDDQRAEGQPPADDDLLHVQQVDAVPGQRGEQHRAHPGPVRPGHRDQHARAGELLGGMAPPRRGGGRWGQRDFGSLARLLLAADGLAPPARTGAGACRRVRLGRGTVRPGAGSAARRPGAPSGSAAAR